MPRTEKKILNYQVTSKMPKDLVNRVDKICSEKLQARGAWIRQVIIEKVREEEAKKIK
jgi:metal-responsive CopG/Arc/MetJ family transcriptional regulator